MDPRDVQGQGRPFMGAMIATALTVYAMIAAQRQQRMPLAERAGHAERGRYADVPQQIPAAGWADILKRVFSSISRDNISLMAAGVAFYALLSLTPAFTALVSIYGLVFDPAQVQSQVASLEGAVPEEARKLIADQLTSIVRDGSESKLGVGLIISLAIALWSANSGTSSLMSALNVTYAEKEKRSVLTYYAHSLLLTAALVVFGIVSLVLVAVIPAVIGLLPLGDFGQMVISWMRWPLLTVFSVTGLAMIYRYAPSRNEPRWSWVNWGAVSATALWIIGSALFSIYVGTFATYNKTYGSLGAVVVLLMWFWLSAFAVLLGSELNAEMEHQTVRDTTDRPRKPMGARGAYAADTVAKSG